MAEPSLATLARWEEHGAVWRTKSINEGEAVVELCTCYGEPVDVLRSKEPELLRYLARRPDSQSKDADG